MQVTTPRGMDGAIRQEAKGAEDGEAELSYPAPRRESAEFIDNRRRPYRPLEVVVTPHKSIQSSLFLSVFLNCAGAC